MPGFLQKAIRLTASRPPPPSDISADERKALLAQIDEVVERARTPISPEVLSYTPERRGVFLPLLVNIAGIVLLVFAAVSFPLFFNRQEQTLTGGQGGAITGEAVLVSTIRQESENQLKSKNQEIGQIQDRLQQTRSQLDALQANADAQVQKKREELQAAMDTQLAAERARLKQAGLSSEAIDQQLKAAQDKQQAAFDSQLAAFRKQKDDEVAAQQALLNGQLVQAQGSLAQAQTEKSQLQAQLAAASTATQNAQSAQGQLAQQLADLQDQKQREQLVLDQITSSYAAVSDAMKAGRWDDAVKSLDSLSGYLDLSTVASLPAVQRRRAVDLFLIDSLQKLAAARTAAPDQAGQPAVAAAPAATAETDAAAARRRQATDTLAAADALYAAGSYREAVDKYGAALALLKDDVAGMDRAAARLADAGYRQGLADVAARSDTAARPTLDKADALARAGNSSAAVSAYASIIRTWPDSTYVARAMNAIESAVTAIVKAKDDESARAAMARSAAASDKLSVLGAGLSAAARDAPVNAADQRELIGLLDAKVKVKSVLAADSVQEQYPGLSSALDRYLQLYGEEQNAKGRGLALQDISTVLDYMLGKKQSDAVTPIWNRYGDDAERAAFQQLLDRLKGLYQ